jgi:hypothetical protein
VEHGHQLGQLHGLVDHREQQLVVGRVPGRAPEFQATLLPVALSLHGALVSTETRSLLDRTREEDRIAQGDQLAFFGVLHYPVEVNEVTIALAVREERQPGQDRLLVVGLDPVEQ